MPLKLAHVRAPEPAPRARISLCMIVRDEAEFLPDCLRSVRGIVDEICAVDTGSTDDTPAILLEHGAKLAQMDWPDDFAVARNASLALATGDWILILDADERLMGDAGRILRRAARLAVDAHLLTIVNIVEDGPLDGTPRQAECFQAIRFFRRDPRIVFRGACHESVEVALAEHRLRLEVCPVEIVHLGYRPAVLAARAKFERNLDLLLRSNQKDPLDPYTHLHLARAYAALDRHDEAEPFWRSAWALRHQGTAPCGIAAISGYARWLADRGRARDAVAALAEGLATYPDASPLCELVGRIGDATSDETLWQTWWHRASQATSDEEAAGALARAIALEPALGGMLQRSRAWTVPA